MERAEDIFLPVAPGACREVEVAGCASLGPGEREDRVWGPGHGGAVCPFVDGHEVEGGDWLLTKGCAERIDSLLPLLPSRSMSVWVLIIRCGSGVETSFVSDLLASPGNRSKGCWGLSQEGRLDAKPARAVPVMG